MASWAELEREAPDLAAAARERFDAHRHKVLATLRAGGAPRISGIEATFADGELWVGMMPASRKGSDLRRDPRMALHSSSPEPDESEPSAWAGDAKLSGRATLVEDPSEVRRFTGAAQEQMPSAFDLFRIDIAELTLVRVGDPPDHLVIETWHEGRGVRRVDRT